MSDSDEEEVPVSTIDSEADEEEEESFGSVPLLEELPDEVAFDTAKLEGKDRDPQDINAKERRTRQQKLAFFFIKAPHCVISTETIKGGCPEDEEEGADEDEGAEEDGRESEEAGKDAEGDEEENRGINVRGRVMAKTRMTRKTTPARMRKGSGRLFLGSSLGGTAGFSSSTWAK